jgi:hypothetical protein
MSLHAMKVAADELGEALKHLDPCPKPKWWQLIRPRHCLHHMSGQRLDSHPEFHNGLQPVWVDMWKCCRCPHEETTYIRYGASGMDY